MANNYPPRDMSEAERRRRAAVRAKRRRRIRRNRIIFAVACMVILAAFVFGIVQLVHLISGKNEDEKTAESQTNAQSTAQKEETPQETPEPTLSPEPPAAMAEDDSRLLTLINNNVPLPEGWSIVTEIAEPGNQKELADIAARAYQEMKGAAALDGIELLLCSGYRTVEYQQDLFDKQKQKWIDKGMSEEEAYKEAKKVVAVPGYSEHNSGLAADIVTPKHQTMDAAFADTDAGKWLAQHAPEYGFILRYPENKQAITGIIYEPWHFRYVGKENAKKITESGKCLEEYLDENA